MQVHTVKFDHEHLSKHNFHKYLLHEVQFTKTIIMATEETTATQA